MNGLHKERKPDLISASLNFERHKTERLNTRFSQFNKIWEKRGAGATLGDPIPVNMIVGIMLILLGSFVSLMPTIAIMHRIFVIHRWRWKRRVRHMRHAILDMQHEKS